MLIAIIVIVGLSLLVLGHEAGHFLAAKLFGLKVDEFGFGFPPRIGATKIGETEYSFNWLPFGGFVRISGERGEFEMIDPEATDAGHVDGTLKPKDAGTSRLFYAQPAWKKSVILLAGVVTNFIFGWIFISIALAIGTPQALVIGGTEAGSPAAQAGIMTGDVVKGFTTAQSFIDFIDAHRGQPTQIAVLRNDKEVDFTITPRVETAPNEGALGVELAEAGSPREPIPSALLDGLQSAWTLLGMTLLAFYELIKNLFVHGSLLAGVVGPVGIFGVAEETGKIGLVYLLQFLGVISINLTVVNCIPFPALDGGRFIMTIVEKIKGSAISEKIEAWVNGLGFAFLILLMLLLTIRDIKGLF